MKNIIMVINMTTETKMEEKCEEAFWSLGLF